MDMIYISVKGQTVCSGIKTLVNKKLAIKRIRIGSRDDMMNENLSEESIKWKEGFKIEITVINTSPPLSPQ